MIINKKIGRTIRQKRSQYIGSVILIMLACLLFTMGNTMMISLKSNTAAFRKSNVQESAYFITQNKIKNMGELKKLYNINLEERRSFDYQYSDTKDLRIFDETKKVDIPYIISGHDIQSDNEMILSQGFAKANKINIGDKIKINKDSYKVVGLADFPDYNYAVKGDTDLIADANTFGQAAISKAAMSKYSEALTFYSIKFNQKNEDAFKKALASQDVIIKWSDASQNTRIATTDVKMVSLASIGTSVPVFILIISCLIIGIVMARLVRDENIQIGTLYAIGYTKKQIIHHYLTYSIVVGLLGSVLGTVLGALCVKPMISYYLEYFNTPVQKIDFNAAYCLVSLFAPTIFLVVTVYFILQRSLKLTAVELIRGGNQNHKLNVLERNIKLNRFSFSTKFKIRELVRNVPRSLLLLIGVIFASAMLLFGFSISDEVKAISGVNLENTYKYQYEYIFNSLKTTNPKSGESFSLTPFALKSDKTQILVLYGVDTNSKYLSLQDSKGDSLPLNQTIISKTLADNLKLKQGDTISVVSALTSKTYKIKIDAITSSNVGTQMFMPIDKFNSLMGYPTNSYLGVWSDTKLNFDQSTLVSQTSIKDIKSAYNTMLAPLKYMVSVIAFFAFIIGLVIIYIVTSLVIEENKLNISLMKVLGYSKKRIYSLLLNSNTILVVLGFLIAIPFMLNSIGSLMQNSLKSLNISFNASISLQTAIISFVIVYLTYEISKFLTRRKINRISMSETLKSRAE